MTYDPFNVYVYIFEIQQSKRTYINNRQNMSRVISTNSTSIIIVHVSAM